MEEKDEKILRENIEYIVSRVLEKINETEEKKDKKKSNGKLKGFLNKLNNTSLNLAPMAEKMFSNLTPDAARSLFSKKRRGKPISKKNPKGAKFGFTPKEVEKGLSFLEKNKI